MYSSSDYWTDSPSSQNGTCPTRESEVVTKTSSPATSSFSSWLSDSNEFFINHQKPSKSSQDVLITIDEEDSEELIPKGG